MLFGSKSKEERIADDTQFLLRKHRESLGDRFTRTILDPVTVKALFPRVLIHGDAFLIFAATTVINGHTKAFDSERVRQLLLESSSAMVRKNWDQDAVKIHVDDLAHYTKLFLMKPEWLKNPGKWAAFYLSEAIFAGRDGKVPDRWKDVALVTASELTESFNDMQHATEAVVQRRAYK